MGNVVVWVTIFIAPVLRVGKENCANLKEAMLVQVILVVTADRAEKAPTVPAFSVYVVLGIEETIARQSRILADLIHACTVDFASEKNLGKKTNFFFFFFTIIEILFAQF